MNVPKAKSLSLAVWSYTALPAGTGTLWLQVRQIRELIWLKSG